jgi:acyl-CoA synthetase (AMP-forming)/AMP-acid ligase II
MKIVDDGGEELPWDGKTYVNLLVKWPWVIGSYFKWDERPLLVVVKKSGADVSKGDLIKFYDGKIAKWWTPDDVAFVDALPIGATGKILKNKIREQFKE